MLSVIRNIPSEIKSDKFNYSNPDVFGPGVWYTMHQLSYACSYQGLSLDVLNSLFAHLKKTIPCRECRMHFSKTISNINDQSDAFNYMFRVHNIVNSRLKHPKPELEIVKRWYETGEVEYSDLINIKHPFDRIGPGCWWLLHSTAMFSTNLFNIIINMYSVSYPCVECRDDIRRQLHAEPLEHIMNSQGDVSEEAFQWIWRYHNMVNARLGKNLKEWKVVHSYFKNDEACDVDCRNEKGKGSIGDKDIKNYRRDISVIG